MKFIKLALITGISLSIASCHVSDPDFENIPDTNQKVLIESITFQNVPITQYSYDSQNRITEITSMPFKVNIGYNPMSLTLCEFDEDNKSEIIEKSTWKDIEVNTQGYITKAVMDVYEYGTLTDNYIVLFQYDAKGHLTEIQRIDEYPSTTVLTWDEEGRLLRSSETGSDGNIHLEYEYYSTPNTHGQWVPTIQIINTVIEATGLFGVAPSYLIKSYSFNENNYYFSQYFYNYRLNDNGHIVQSQVSSDGYTILLNWHYSK